MAKFSFMWVGSKKLKIKIILLNSIEFITLRLFLKNTGGHDIYQL